MYKYPPLPNEFSSGDLRLRLHRWHHMNDKRKKNFVKACIQSIIGWKRLYGILPKKNSAKYNSQGALHEV